MRYFIAKSINFDSLRRCQHSSIWACRDRTSPPQPRELLSEALTEGPVTLIFSVNNCHGWHGYAHMLSVPGTVSEGEHQAEITSSATPLEGEHQAEIISSATPLEGEPNDLSAHKIKDEWHRFKIQWKKLFLNEHGEQCLAFSRTDKYKFPDGQTLNKARNYQEIPQEIGKQICELIDEDYQRLTDKKLMKIESRRPPAFFESEATVTDPDVVWRRLLSKVEKMGQVLLACAFGSQRYNLHTPESDMDMFIVYAADTKDILGLNPPQHTIKNRDIDTCDYTIHEVHRYCELLVGGDPRCVETLFLHPSSIYHASPHWKQLCQHNKRFISRECMEKYMRDALGGKGMRLMEKWTATGEAKQQPMTAKVGKLFYIIIRLLQNARDAAAGDRLNVYRAEDSAERKLLMSARRCESTYDQLMVEVNRLQQEIECLKETKNNTDEANAPALINDTVEDWLITLRYENLTFYMTKKNLKTETEIS